MARWLSGFCVSIVVMATVLSAQEGPRQIAAGGFIVASGVLDASRSSASRTFSVETVAGLTIVIVSPIRLSVDVVLPDGRRIGDDEFSHFLIADAMSLPVPSLGKGQHALVALEAPLSGQYVVQVAAITPLTQFVPYRISLMPTGGVRLGVGLPQSELTLGEPVVISAFPLEGRIAIRGATVSASIVADPVGGPGSNVFGSVPLLDDGAGADAASQDGVYSGMFVPQAPGRYAAVVHAAGSTSDGRHFERSGSATFVVNEQTARLTGSFGAVGIDENANGIYDSLRVRVGAAITTAGTYDLQVVLRASNGKTIGSNAVGDLNSGAYDVDVDFSAADVLRLESDAPYTIAVARLDELTQVDRALRAQQRNAAELTGFRRSQFEGFNVAAIPGDLDNDGDIDLNDLSILLGSRNTPVSRADDPRDLDRDGAITSLDARKLQTLCTRPRCAVQ